MKRRKSDWSRLCGSRSRYVLNGRRLGDQMVTSVVSSALRCKKWSNCKDQQSKFTNSFWLSEMFIPTKIFGGTGLLQMSQIYGQSGLFRNTCAAFTGQVGWPHLFDAYILQHFTFSSHLGLITNHFSRAIILTNLIIVIFFTLTKFLWE